VKNMLRSALCAASLLGLALPAAAQPTLTLPPAGGNQKTSVTQQMGLVQITIEYNSVDVHGPNGEDRKGKIWGQLVPWGEADLGFNGGKKSPWRAGSNQNTTFAVSHGVEVQGKKLPAGKYGVHMIPAENGDWTLIFSKNADAWGSFFYDPKDDALRVGVKAEKSDYHEWLDFTFEDRQLDGCTVALVWENLRVPFKVAVPDTVDLYVGNLRRELTGANGFVHQSFDAAANYILQNDKQGKYLDQALAWSNQAMNPQIGGRRDLNTLMTNAIVLDRLNKADDSKKARQEALKDPLATPLQIHFAARLWNAAGKNQEAFEIFQENARRFPGQWPTELGLARGYSGLGGSKKALEHAKKALATAPDEAAKRNVEGLIARLEKDEKIN
jgi:hypothetical protein